MTKKVIREQLAELECWCEATKVINQLQYFISIYGEDNVHIEYDCLPYESNFKHVIAINRLETDDEYEKRVAHETWKQNKKEAEEKLLLEQLKAKYEQEHN
jgi:hypothetical protein